MEYESILSALGDQGYAHVPAFVNGNSLKELSEGCQQILSNPISNEDFLRVNGKRPLYHVPAFVSPIKKIQGSFLGKTPALDKFARGLFENPDFLNLIHHIVGSGFKITTFNLRQANSESQADGLHQDGSEQFSIGFLLNDIAPDMPTTIFVPQSHRFLHNIKDSIEPLPFSTYKPLVVPCIGKAGDLCLFFNKTWHGMQRGHGTSTVLLVAFDPAGYQHSPKTFPEMTEYGIPFREAVGERLYSFLDPKQGVVEKNGKFYVAGQEKQDNRLIDFCLENQVNTPKNRMISLYMQTLSGMYRSARAVKNKLAA